MNAYFLSGLGADEKAFARIRSDVYTTHYVPWPEHNVQENLTAYAQKVIPLINTSEPFALVGLSFGGIVAQELCQFIKPEKVVLISSIRQVQDFPWYYKAGKPLVKHLPNSLFGKPNAVVNSLFGAKGRSSKMLEEIISASDPDFMKWAVKEILHWEPKPMDTPLVSIHGTNDKLIPSYKHADYVIEGGTHFMVFDKAKEINKILDKELC